MLHISYNIIRRGLLRTLNRSFLEHSGCGFWFAVCPEAPRGLARGGGTDVVGGGGVPGSDEINDFGTGRHTNADSRLATHPGYQVSGVL